MMIKFNWSALEEDIAPIRHCDEPGCMLEAEYPAPKSPFNLQERYYFCLEHVKAYNAKWNYYAHMNEGEVEKSRINDTVWERPSWPFGHAQKISFRHAIQWNKLRFFDHVGVFQEHHCEFNGHTPSNSTWFKPQTPEAQAIALLELPFPFSRDQLKKTYKALAKQCHPDLNNNCPDSLERFRAIKDAYELLLHVLDESAA